MRREAWIFQASLRNCKNWVYNYENHSFTWFHIGSSIYDLFHITYHFIIDLFLMETLEPTNDQLPVSVAHSSLGLSVAPESRDHRFKPRWSPEFCRLLCIIAKIAFITARIIIIMRIHLSYISAVQYMIYFISSKLNEEMIFISMLISILACIQPTWSHWYCFFLCLIIMYVWGLRVLSG